MEEPQQTIHVQLNAMILLPAKVVVTGKKLFFRKIFLINILCRAYTQRILIKMFMMFKIMSHISPQIKKVYHIQWLVGKFLEKKTSTQLMMYLHDRSPN